MNVWAWVVFFFLVPHVFWLDAWQARWVGLPVDFGLAVCFVLALFVRTAALPGLLLGVATGSALFGDGSLALHFLAYGLPVAVLIPLRNVFFRGSMLWQGVAAAFLALSVPRVAHFFGGLVGESLDAAVPAMLVPGVVAVLTVAVSTPPISWLLRQVPPLRSFVEVAA